MRKFYTIYVNSRVIVRHFDAYTESMVKTVLDNTVGVLSGDKLVIDKKTWFLYVGDMIVMCGDVSSLHAIHQEPCATVTYYTYQYDAISERNV